MKKTILSIALCMLFGAYSIHANSDYSKFESSSEEMPSCFSDCNTAGQALREAFGWTALEMGAWIINCTNMCENQQ